MIQEKTIVQRLLEFENATHCTESIYVAKNICIHN